MCGICGYIGESQEPEVTFGLCTHLFKRTESRGEDAAGIWGVAEDKKILYHKEPIKSSEFVCKSFWQKVGEFNPNLLLCHARAASMGVGIPSINKNNHPFISTDKSIGLVHNGRIPDVEYKALKKKYPTLSNCDSEILLRIFEASTYMEEEKAKEFENFDREVAIRLGGMKDIWSFLSLGHMAVAIGETKADHRRLWLFRNKHRSLWLADMRKLLGQVFFFSTPEIWRSAISDYEQKDVAFAKIDHGIKLIELPPEEIWLFNINADIPVTNKRSLKRFEVCSSGKYQTWHEDQIGDAIPVGDRSGDIEVITDLEDDEKVKEEKRSFGFGKTSASNPGKTTYQNKNYASMAINEGGYANSGGNNTSNALSVIGAPSPSLSPSQSQNQSQSQSQSLVNSASYPLSSDEIDIGNIDRLCDSIKELTSEIKAIFSNRILANSASHADYQDLKSQLELVELDMTGILNILDR